MVTATFNFKSKEGEGGDGQVLHAHLAHRFCCVSAGADWKSESSITDKGFLLFCKCTLTMAFSLPGSRLGVKCRATATRLPNVQNNKMLRLITKDRIAGVEPSTCRNLED